jgi:hypothetical protein
MCNKHLILGQTAVIYTHTYTQSHTFNTFTLKHNTLETATRNTHTHESDESPAKMPGGRVNNWFASKIRVLHSGDTES